MARRITIVLEERAAQQLAQLARDERRAPRDQAALIIERAVARKDRKQCPGAVQR